MFYRRFSTFIVIFCSVLLFTSSVFPYLVLGKTGEANKITAGQDQNKKDFSEQQTNIPEDLLMEIPDFEITVPEYGEDEITFRKIHTRDSEAVNRYRLLKNAIQKRANKMTGSGGKIIFSGSGTGFTTELGKPDRAKHKLNQNLEKEKISLSSGSGSFLKLEYLEDIRKLDALERKELKNRIKSKTKGEIREIKKQKTGKNKKNIQKAGIRSLYASAVNLFAEANPDLPGKIIEYYDGIENNSKDYALYYLSQLQNADGSFGVVCNSMTCSYPDLAERLKNTVAILKTLKILGYTKNEQFEKAKEYIRNFEATDILTKARKLQGFAIIGDDTDTLISEIIAKKKCNGAYGRTEYHRSSLFITLEVANAFREAEYKGPEWNEILAFLNVRQNEDGGFPYTIGIYNDIYDLSSRSELSAFIGEILSTVKLYSDIEKQILEKTLSYLENSRVEQGYFGEGETADPLTTVLSVLALRNNHRSEDYSGDIEVFRMPNGSMNNDVYLTALMLRNSLGADIAVVDMADPTSFVNGEEMSITIIVENKGSVAINNFKLDFYKNNLWRQIWEIDQRVAAGEQLQITINFSDTHYFAGTENLRFLTSLSSDYEEQNFVNNSLEKQYTWTGLSEPYAPEAIGVVAEESSDVSIHILSSRSNANGMSYVIYYGTESGNYSHVAVTYDTGGLLRNLPENVPYYFTAAVKDKDGNISTYLSPEVRVVPKNSPEKFMVSGNTTTNSAALSEVILGKFGVPLGQSDENSVFQLELNEGIYIFKAERDGYVPVYRAVTVDDNIENILFDLPFANDEENPTVQLLELRNGGGEEGNVFKTGDEEQIVYEVDDNIAVKNIDLLYSLNNGTNWQVIEGNIPYSGGAKAYYWTIPNILTETGFIKIIARDYQGNTVESIGTPEPFIIVDGSAPQVEVLSPVSGETWELGKEHIIKWNASSPNGIYSIRILLRLGDYVRYIDEIIGNPGEYHWQIPNSSYYMSNQAKIEIEATDNNYNSFVAESSGYFSIIDTSPLWENVERVSLVPEGSEGYISQDHYAPVAVSDDNGNIHLFYTFVEDDLTELVEHNGARVYTTRIYYQKYDQQTQSWSDPELAHSQTYSTDGGLVGTHFIEDLQVSVDTDNTLHLVWEDSMITSNEHEIFYIYKNGGTWSSPANISNNSTASRSPRLKTDSIGNAHLIWRDGTYYDGDEWQGKVRLYYRKKSGTSWSNVQYLTADNVNSINPSLAIDSEDIIHIGYSYWTSETGPQVYYFQGDGVTWGASEVVSPGISGNLRIAVDQEANPHLVWYRSYQNQYIYYNTKENGQFIETPETVIVGGSEYDVTPRFPSIAVDNQNNIYAIFEDSKQYAVYFTKRTDNGWSEKIRISPESQNPHNSDLVIFGESKGYVFWDAGYNGSNEIYFTAKDLEEAPVNPPSEATNFQAVPDKNSIELSFTPSTDSDLSSQTLYQKSGSSGATWEFVKTFDINTQNYSVSGLLQDTYYAFKLTSVNTGGVESEGVVVETRTSGAEKIAYWDFDDTGHRYVQDSNGGGYIGVLKGGAVAVPGKNGKAISFDGVDDSIDMGMNKNLAFSSSDDFTISAWVNPEQQAGYQHLVGDGNLTYRMGLWEGKLDLRVEQNTLIVTADQPLPLNEWSHVAASYEASTKMIRLYVNGEAVKNGSNENLAWISDLNPFSVGESVAEGYNFKGEIDELRVYKKAITGAEILASSTPAGSGEDNENTAPAGWLIVGLNGDYATLEAAITSIQNNQENNKNIFIQSGHVEEIDDQLTISTPGITIMGASAESVRITQTNPARDGIRIYTDDITISGITIDTQTHSARAALVVKGDRTTILNSKFYGPEDIFTVYFAGPFLQAGEETLIAYRDGNLNKDNIFENNEIYTPEMIDSWDVFSWSLQDGGIVKDNLIVSDGSSRSVVYMAKNAVYINNRHVGCNITISTPAENIEVAKNIVENTDYSGIVTMVQNEHGAPQGIPDWSETIINEKGVNISVRNNIVVDTKYHGIEIKKTSGAIVAENAIHETDYHGMYIFSSNDAFFKENYTRDIRLSNERDPMWQLDSALSAHFFFEQTSDSEATRNIFNNFRSTALHAVIDSTNWGNVNISTQQNRSLGNFNPVDINQLLDETYQNLNDIKDSYVNAKEEKETGIIDRIFQKMNEIFDYVRIVKE